MANNLHRWSNGVNLNSADINNKSVKGYQPNDYLESNVLNTILKECSLVSQMIGEYLGKSTNIDCNTTTDALLTQFTNTLNGLTVAKATDLNQPSTTGNAVLYQNDDSTTSVLEAPDGNSVLTYSSSNDSLEWVEPGNIPTSLSNMWATGEGNLITISNPGNYLVKAIVNRVKEGETLSTFEIDELFAISDLNHEIHGKVVYSKISSGSQPGNDTYVACQLRYTGSGNIRLYVTSITASTTVYDLIDIPYSANYNSQITLQFKLLK